MITEVVKMRTGLVSCLRIFSQRKEGRTRDGERDKERNGCDKKQRQYG
jgi:hypothetical protein